MHGRVAALVAKAGERVAAGTPLLVLEAMKMEHTVRAASAGTLEGFCVAEGAFVAGGARLVRFTPDDAP